MSTLKKGSTFKDKPLYTYEVEIKSPDSGKEARKTRKYIIQGRGTYCTAIPGSFDNIVAVWGVVDEDGDSVFEIPYFELRVCRVLKKEVKKELAKVLDHEQR